MKIKNHLGKIYLVVVIITYICANLYIYNNITIPFMIEYSVSIINPMVIFSFCVGIIWTISEILINKK